MEADRLMHILQVCNVGQIVGGTAACAWTITRALADCRHSVAFLGQVAPATREVFSTCRLLEWQNVVVNDVDRLNPDVVILHNTPRSRVEWPITAPTIQYVHSHIKSADSDLTVYCSKWLAHQCGASEADVLYQSVSIPPKNIQSHETRAHREFPVIGRLCTPQSKKWPLELASFYRALATEFPQVRWEFVGCPESLRDRLSNACKGNVQFHEASWQQRNLLWEWDALLYHNPRVTESFGRTAAEAMRAGCIPIVDRRGGFVEQVAEQTGFLCETFEEFCQAIQRICNPGERRRRSRACREHAEQQFSLVRFRSDLLARINQAVQNCEVAQRKPFQPSTLNLRHSEAKPH